MDLQTCAAAARAVLSAAALLHMNVIVQTKVQQSSQSAMLILLRHATSSTIPAVVRKAKDSPFLLKIPLEQGQVASL